MAVLISDSNNSKYGTSVATIAVNNAGSGYSASDVLTLTGGDGNATVTVLTVGGSGEVLTVSRTTVGSGYSAGTESTTVAPAGGSGCTIDITVQAGLGCVNGWYTVENYNLNASNSTQPNYGDILTSALYIPFTPASGYNLQGIMIFVGTRGAATGNDYDVTVTLQENVASVWTDRATATKTAEEINDTDTIYRGGENIIAIKGGTFPYTVTAAASTWRFKVEQSGGTVGGWGLGENLSSGGEYGYAIWSDTQATASSGNDVLIFADKVIVDQSFTFSYVNKAGSATDYKVGGILCTVAAPSITTVPMAWENPPQASYTLDATTSSVYIQVGSNSGFAIGNSTDKISPSQQAIVTSNLYFTPSTRFSVANNISQHYVYMYGETPSGKVLKTTFVGNITSGATSLTSAEETGWVSGDTVAVGRRTAAGSSTTTANRLSLTVDSTSGTTVNFTSGIQDNRTSGGAIFLTNGYGVKFDGQIILCLNGLQMVGVCGTPYIYSRSGNMSGYFSGSSANQWVFGDPARDTENLIQDCAFESSATSSDYMISFWNMSRGDLTIKNVYINNMLLDWYVYSYVASWYNSGTVTIDGCVQTNHMVNNSGVYGNTYPTTSPVIFTGNTFENSIWCFYIGGGVKSRIYNNIFWGSQGGGGYSYGAVFLYNYLKPGLCGSNYFDNNECGLEIGGYTSFDVQFTGDFFSTVVANTVDIQLDRGGLVDFIFKDATFSTISNDITGSVDGSMLRFVNYNTTSNDDRVYSPYGTFQRTGSGLADTTVHTAGGYAIRFEPTSSTSNLEWEFTIPTGNIQNKTMMVGVWVKINSATYYAGTHQMPRITVDYDNGTTAYSEAAESTDWQFLPLPITPTTTYGQITVTLSGRTDATTTDSYVYWDDFVTIYPADTPLNTQTFDLWANALPVTPPIATVLSAFDVWSADLTTVKGFTGAIGEYVGKKLLTIGKFIGLK